MKIIGQRTEKYKNVYLLEAEDHELANLIGYHSEHDAKLNGELKHGAEIQVAKMYNQLWSLSRSEGTLSGAISSIRKLLDALELQNPVITEAIEGIDCKPDDKPRSG